MNSLTRSIHLALGGMLLTSPAAMLAGDDFPAVIQLGDMNTMNGVAGISIHGAQAADYAGNSINAVGDINGDGFIDLAVGASQADGLASGYSSNSGRVYVLFGKQNGLPDEIDLAQLDAGSADPGTGLVIVGADGLDYAGKSVTSAGDINGDGFDDLALGAYLANPGSASGAGEVYVIFGQPPGTLPTQINLAEINTGNSNAAAGIRIAGANLLDRAGTAVAGGGDFNNDGVDDLLIGAPQADPNAILSGQAYIVYGDANDLPDVIELSALNGTGSSSTAGVTINGIENRDIVGTSVSVAGDINGDGVDDFLLGAPDASPDGQTYAGSAFLLYGSSDNSLPPVIELADLNADTATSVAGVRFDGGIALDDVGRDVSAAGDFNADGISDLLIGAPGINPNGLNSGGAYLIFGSADPGLPELVALSDLNVTGPAGIVFNGAGSNQRAGSQVAGIGDFNGDLVDDIHLGIPSGNFGNGQSIVVYGAADASAGTVELADLNQPGGAAGVLIQAAAVLSSTGSALADDLDLNNDGSPDLAIGASSADGPAGMGSGQAYVVFGPSRFDSSISKSNQVNFVATGEPIVWTITVRNELISPIEQVLVTDNLPDTLDVMAATWTCSATGGAVCDQAAGTGNIVTSGSLPGLAELVFTLTAPVIADENEMLLNTASVQLGNGLTDSNNANNQSTDEDAIAQFADGFEE